jgi:CHAT domain-containing protein
MFSDGKERLMFHRTRRYATSRWLAQFVILLTLPVLLLVGCQSTQKTVSLEEAKNITATFVEVAPPPPKTIDDIRLLLDGIKLESPEEQSERIALVNETPPTGLSDKAAYTYFSKRAKAAKILGLVQEEASNWEAALKAAIATGIGSKKLSNVYSKAAWAQFKQGRPVTAMDMMQKALDTHPKNLARVVNLARMAQFIGDIKAVHRYADIVATWRPGRRAPPDRIKFVRLETEAVVAQAEGRWADTVDITRRQLAAFEVMNSKSKKLSLRLSIERNLIQAMLKSGQVLPAEIAARDGLKRALAAYGKDSDTSAKMLLTLSQVLMRQGRFSEVSVILDEAEKIIRARNGSPQEIFLNGTLFKRGQALAADELWESAMAKFDQVRTNMGADNLIYKSKFQRKTSHVLTLIKVGRVDEAERLAQNMVRGRTKKLGNKHQSTAEARGLLALALLKRGDARSAFENFSKATPILMSRSRQTDEDDNTGIKEKFNRYVLEGYIALLATDNGAQAARAAGMDPLSESFVIANRARARAVQRALAASAARAGVNNPELAELVRREQDTRLRISTLYGVLAAMVNVPSAEQDLTAIETVRIRIDDLRAARSALMQEIEGRFPDYAQIINPKPATVETVRANLRQGETLISFLVAEEATYSWAIPKTGELAFGTSELSSQDVGDMVTDLRAALDPKAATLGDIPDFDLELATEVYDALLKPIEKGWKDAANLLIANDGAVGQLPIALLPTEKTTMGADSELLFARYRKVPWLIRNHTVSYLPSPAALLTLRTGKVTLPPNRQAFAGFADPFFNSDQAEQAETRENPIEVAMRSGALQIRGLPLRRRAAPASSGASSFTLKDLPRLPDTGIEVASMAVALKSDPATNVFSGAAASEKRIKEMDLSDRKVIAFATHGLVAGELDGLSEPALALSDPKVSGADGEDGLLTMSEIMALRLNADWVVLSACNTAAADGQGSEAVSGLGSAFFYAGARALLATSWPVETSSARILTTKLFSLQSKDPNLSRSQALRQAKLHMIDDGAYEADGKLVFSYAHPIFWAPFILVGEGGAAPVGS